jgi:Flp pilus assembly protein TadD
MRKAVLIVVAGLAVMAVIVIYLNNKSANSSRVPAQSDSGPQVPPTGFQYPPSNNAGRLIEQQASVLYDQGVVLTRLGHYAEAADRFQETVALKPDFAEAQHELGYTLYRIGKYRDSVEASIWKSESSSLAHELFA